MRKYNGGKWTEGRFRGFVVGLLRAGSKKWPPKYETLNKALTERKINEATGKMANHYKCAKCKQLFPLTKVEVDHKKPVVSDSGFTNYEDYIDRLFCEADNLQVLCKPCHKAKSKVEAGKRASKRNASKAD